MKVSGLVLQADSAVGRDRVSSRRPWPGMTSGRLFSARVVAVESGGLFSLDLEGRTVVARSGLPLTVGEELFLKVKEAGPPPVLVPVAVDAGNTSILFSRLLALLDRNDADGFAAAMIPAHSDQGGPPFFQFSDRTDLGPFLRLLATLLPRKAGQLCRGGEERDAASRSSDHGGIINLMRQFNDASMAGGDGCCGFPVLYEDGNGYGVYFFSREEGTTAGAMPESVVEFFLLLSSLGEVRVRVGIGPAGIRGDIWLTGESVRKHVRRELDGLEERLGLIAGRGVDLRVRSGPPALRAELARVLGSGGHGLLDARV